MFRKRKICCKCGKAKRTFSSHFKYGRRTKKINVILDLKFKSRFGFYAKIYKPAFICSRCAINEWEDRFEHYRIMDLLSANKTSIIWEKYWELISKMPESQIEINQFFRDMGILSFNKTGYIICNENNEALISGPNKTFYCIPNRKHAFDCVKELLKRLKKFEAVQNSLYIKIKQIA